MLTLSAYGLDSGIDLSPIGQGGGAELMSTSPPLQQSLEWTVC